jgi:tRNA(Ser,Leu) C12 N-acetylase TAN1
MNWNLLVTLVPGRGHESEVLGALSRFGRFRRTGFRDVYLGYCGNVDALLDAIVHARLEERRWARHIGRVIPLEAVFSFAPESLAARLEAAVAPLAARMQSGSFHVRLERRGMEGEVATQEIERILAEHVDAIATARGVVLRTDFSDPDYVVAVETVGNECGVALITRVLRERYPFVRPR